MDRYVCVHGHFYQPPRENPWLEAIERQDSAYPYHDWNARITAECYAPNGASRIEDGEGRIAKIVNNYARISFNVGPTLLSWMERAAPRTYAAVLDADRESRARFSGHGCAIAQVYNHMILPLANRRDRWTQVRWGIRDFEHRFGRAPEGMWLSETAADLESLDIMAEQGIKFTILAPSQARRVRRPGGRWRDVSGGRVDPTTPYEVLLSDGRRIAVFFYDGAISRAVAFERLLNDGRGFADRLRGAFSEKSARAQLVHIATDGESYGHHHRHGDMALGYALEQFDADGATQLTNYGEYLERHPPADQAEIFEQSSWSCAHGVGRWWSDCGCNSGHAGWNQSWRAPLRNALDWLRDEVAPRYEKGAGRLLRDPWAARDDYVSVILDRSAASRERFWERQATRRLEDSERIEALKLLELQRHAQLMYTSCGWFFDDLSGIETVQVIHYAGRVVQLARETLGFDPEPEFMRRLSEARSNQPEHGDGAQIYERCVKPAMVDLPKVAAHYAISSLFESYDDEDRIYSYSVRREDVRVMEAGKARVLIGRAAFICDITGETARISFGALHLGDHNIQAGVREYRGEEAYESLADELHEPFDRGDFPEVIRILDRHYDGVTSSLRSLFRDEQRKIVDMLLEATLEDAEARLGQIYEQHAPLMRFLSDIDTPAPKVLRTAAEFVINSLLKRALAADAPDEGRVRKLIDAARREGVTLDATGLAYALRMTMERAMERLHANPADLEQLKRVEALARLAATVPFEVDLWWAQNLYYEMLHESHSEFRARADDEARAWLEHFTGLGEKLSVRGA